MTNWRDTFPTYRDYSNIPAGAAYLGGSYPDGSIDLSTLDAIDDALAPVCLIESDGTRHYFETAIEID
jgi:hypothetical protein